MLKVSKQERKPRGKTVGYKLDMAAFKGETVTQGHADYCTNNGHATLQGASAWCHRCGDNA